MDFQEEGQVNAHAQPSILNQTSGLGFLLVLFECLQQPCRIQISIFILQVKKLDSEKLRTFPLTQAGPAEREA